MTTSKTLEACYGSGPKRVLITLGFSVGQGQLESELAENSC